MGAAALLFGPAVYTRSDGSSLWTNGELSCRLVWRRSVMSEYKGDSVFLERHAVSQKEV